MKDYLNFEGLSRFLNNLFLKFAVISHTHTKYDIVDLNTLTVISDDDSNGNVTLICTSEDIEQDKLN